MDRLFAEIARLRRDARTWEAQGRSETAAWVGHVAAFLERLVADRGAATRSPPRVSRGRALRGETTPFGT
jgi:hypothetical protein